MTDDKLEVDESGLISGINRDTEIPSVAGGVSASESETKEYSESKMEFAQKIFDYHLKVQEPK